MVSPADVAMIEQWAASRYPDLREGTGRLVVRPRGSDVLITERWSESGVERNRLVLELRWVTKTRRWTLYRAVAGGRWLPERPDDGPLEQLLDALELEALPA